MCELNTSKILIASLTFLGSILFGCDLQRGSDFPNSNTSLSVRIKEFPNTLSPVNLRKISTRQIVDLNYQSLQTIDINYSLVPVLAKELGRPDQIAEDTIQYYFQLRERAVWGDGLPVTSEDVAFSLKLYNLPFIENDIDKIRLTNIVDIDLISEKEFSITVAGTQQSTQRTILDFYILPRHYFDPNGDLEDIVFSSIKKNPEGPDHEASIKRYTRFYNDKGYWSDTLQFLGSGPYYIEGVELERFVKLKKKESWWGDGLAESEPYFQAHPPTIIFNLIPEDLAALIALQNGDIDVMGNLSINDFKNLKDDEDSFTDINLYEPQSYKFVHLGFNTRKSRFNDKNVRIGLSHLIPYDLIVDLAIRGSGQRTIGFIHPADTVWYERSIPLTETNAEKAADFLREAGFEKQADSWVQGSTGEPLSLKLLVNPKEAVYENIALIIQEEFRKFGINLEMESRYDYDLFSNKLNQYDFDLYLHSFSAGRDMYFNLDPVLSSTAKSNLNYPGYASRDIDLALENIRLANSQPELMKAFSDIQHLVYDARAYIFLYFENNRIAVNKRIENVKVSHVKPGYDLTAMKIKTRAMATVQ